MVNNRAVKEYEDWENSQNSMWNNLMKNLLPIHVIAFFALIIFGVYLVQSNSINKNYALVAIGFVVIVMLFKGQSKREREPIPEGRIKVICNIEMQRKIGSPEFPTGTIIQVGPYCGMRYEGEWGKPFVPWKWEVGVKVRYPDSRKEDLLVILHPYDGYITKIMRMPAGYTGQESTDLKVLLPTQFEIKEDKPKA